MRLRLSAAVALAFGVLLALLPASTASAHAAILGTDPGSGVVVSASPNHVSVRFSERVSLTTRSISVVAPDGSAAARGPAQSSGGGRVLTQPLRPNLRHGTYVVSFRIISADGHPVGGGFSFSVVEPSKPAAVARGSGEAKVEGLVRDAVWAGRYAGYAGAALLVGAVVIGIATRTVVGRRRRITTLSTVGGGVALAGTALNFVCQVPYAYGGSFADISRSELWDVADSTVGRAYLMRLVLLGFIVVWLRLAYRPEFVSHPSRWRDAVLAAAGVATILTWPFAGHAAVSRVWP
ncbi:MAG: copper resistance CopC family protein, partial [Mycobacteriales bacterium]